MKRLRERVASEQAVHAELLRLIAVALESTDPAKKLREVADLLDGIKR